MYTLNQKIRNLTPYQPVAGTYKIRLDANESAFSLPDKIASQIHAAIEEVDFNRYPDPNATQLCSAFADFYGIDPACVTAGNGSDELISILISSFLMKGETVITAEPDFSMYRFYASLSEMQCICVHKQADLTIDIKKIVEAVRQHHAGMVIFSNPCNPTSKALCAQDVEALIADCPQTLVVLDEAYMDFWEESLLKKACCYENLVILRTASKAVGAAALRLGFAVAGPAVTRALRAVKSPYNVNALSQAAGTVLYHNKEYLMNMKKTIVTLRTNLYNSLAGLAEKYPGIFQAVEGCSNFVLLKTSCADQLYTYMLQNSVAIRKLDGYVRVTTGTQQENEVFLQLLEAFLAKRQKDAAVV